MNRLCGCFLYVAVLLGVGFLYSGLRPSDPASPSSPPSPGQSDADYLIRIGYDVPNATYNATFLFGEDVPDELRRDLVRISDLLRESYGSYRYYVLIVNNESADPSASEGILEALRDEWNEPEVTFEELNGMSCLGGGSFGTKGGGDYIPYSRSMLALSQAHEYFHHYQRVHALDRGLRNYDQSQSADQEDESVGAPVWWVEGAALQVQNAWFRHAWRELPFIARETTFEEAYVNIGSVGDEGQWNAVMRCNRTTNVTYSLPSIKEDACAWQTGLMAASYLTHITSAQVSLVAIVRDYYRLGFWGSVLKHTNLTETQFYDAYNAFLVRYRDSASPVKGFYLDSLPDLKSI